MIDSKPRRDAKQHNVMAAAMRDRLGIRAGDRVAMVLTNIPEMGIIFTAAARLGAITVPFNFMLKAEEITRMVNDCRAKVLFTEPDLFDANIRDKANVPGIDHWVMTFFSPAENIALRRRSREPALEMPVDIAPVTNADHPHDERLVLDRIHDPVVANAHPVSFERRELLASSWSGVVAELADTLHDAHAIVSGDRFQVLQDRTLERHAIACHRASGTRAPLRRR